MEGCREAGLQLPLPQPQAAVFMPGGKLDMLWEDSTFCKQVGTRPNLRSFLCNGRCSRAESRSCSSTHSGNKGSRRPLLVQSVC